MSRCNYSIILIVSKLRFKYTKLYFMGFTPTILTILALLKRPFFTDCKYTKKYDMLSVLHIYFFKKTIIKQ